MSTLFDEDAVSETTAIATVQPANNPLAILSTLVERGGLEPAQINELLAAQERYERNESAKAYAVALTTFQAECPVVHKRRVAKIQGPRANYEYAFASYDDIMAQIGELLTRCGLALSFSTQNQEKGIRVTLKIRHGTHVEDHTLDVPIPAMNVNDTQRYGAALQYAKRYALCAALNIVTTDEDNDASAPEEKITKEQANLLQAYFDEHGLGDDLRRRLFKWQQVDCFADIPASKFDEVMSRARTHANGGQQ